MERENKVSFKTILVAIIPLLSFIAVVVGSTYAYYMITVSVAGNENAENVVLESASVVAWFEATNTIDKKDIMPNYSDKLHFSITNKSTKENLYGRYVLSWHIEKNEINDSSFVYILNGTSTKDGDVVPEDNKNKVVNVNSPVIIPDISTKIGEGIINTGVVHDYTLTVKFLDNGKNQNNLQGKEFKGQIVASGTYDED